MGRSVLAAALLLCSGPALADELAEPPVIWTPSGPATHSFDMHVGLGVGGFTSTLGHLSSVGLSWNLRAGYNFIRYLGVELNYQGTTTTVNDIPKVSSNATCCVAFMENQVTADLRGGFPFSVGFGYLRPYGFAGVGWGYTCVTSAIAVTFSLPNTNAAAFPLGLGLTYELPPGIEIDGRYTYNVLTGGGGNVWNALFSIGIRIGAY